MSVISRYVVLNNVCHRKIRRWHSIAACDDEYGTFSRSINSDVLMNILQMHGHMIMLQGKYEYINWQPCTESMMSFEFHEPNQYLYPSA